jgi:two-component system response regulator AtoC
MGNRIIVVDDERDFLESVRRGLITSGMKNIAVESDPLQAAEAFRSGEAFDVALIDITMPGLNGVDLLEIIKGNSPATEAIMVTAMDDARTAVDCLRKGAYDYLVKPISKEDLVSSVTRALERKRLLEIRDLGKGAALPGLDNPEAFRAIVTRSPAMVRVLREAELHAASDIPILITGETGTGKELLARAVHAASSRSGRTFTAVNMVSLAPQLFESQFFGHLKGAFTGAEKENDGYLETSHRGTLFMDEIGNLPMELQGKLLRVLQEGEFMKLGSSKTASVDIRFIAATNTDLDRMIAQGRFRKDLYYRLKGGWLHLPPLRERQQDLSLLVDHFTRKIWGRESVEIEDDALAGLVQYDYPGNVRELKSILQAAANLARGGSLALGHLPAHMRDQRPAAEPRGREAEGAIVPLHEVEKKYILDTYDRLGKNKTQTARALGIALNTLRSKLESYGAG